ncbi:protein TIME FOR COFFEE isoform X2 [Mangifera indica]|uniref:protein TIME FOR COFFEE isoform X2 n=1 Tax=Mangifera indica TaxID=29780 RepID=UPI001CFAF3F3|nr:protein TIME FOR COFFEE isoform X2 [Mangifera indica]
MERSREAKRGVTLAASNGLSRRRHRSGSLRESPEEDGPLELHETARLRDRKKDRDRDRDRERERDRERDRMSRTSKRRRSDKFMLGTNRDDGGDDSSEESVNDDEEDDDDDGGVGGNSSIRMLPPNPSTSSSSMLNHHHHHHHHNLNSNSHSNNNHNHNNNNHSSRKSFPPPAKVFRAAPTTTTANPANSTWKAADEMIGVSVPRKARSVSTKRSHECWTSSGGGGEQIHRQASSSPVRTSVATVLTTPAPASPSSNFSVRKKMKPSGPKLRPPKSSSNKSSSSAQDEIEIEIAEVLYGMMRQPQGPSKQEIMVVDWNSKEINSKSTSDSKSRVSSPISNSPSTLPQSSSILPTNSSSSIAPMSAIAPKRKRPRPVKYEDENPSSFTVRNVPISSTTKVEMDHSSKAETCSSNLDKISGSAAAENGSISYDLMNSQASEPKIEPVKPESNVSLPDSKGLTEPSESGGDVAVANDGPPPQPQSPKKDSTASLRLDDDCRDSLTVSKANLMTSEIENQREEKFQIDLMAPPPLRSSPERDGEIDFVAVDGQTEMKPVVKEDEKVVKMVKEDVAVDGEQKKVKTIAEESESQKPVVVKERNIDLQLDLEKSDRDGGTVSLNGNKLQQHVHKQQQHSPPSAPEKNAQSTSLPFPPPMASWPGGIPPMGYMAAPLQGVVSMDGSAVSSTAIQPPNLLSSQPRPKRCATHCYIARNIHCLQQFTRINPFWPAAASSASLYGAKACNLNVVPPAELNGTVPGKVVSSAQDMGQGLAVFPGPAGKDNKVSQHANVMDAAQRKQVLLQQALPPGAPSNILAPAFIFPLSQQQAAAAAAVRPGSVKSPPAAGNFAPSSGSNSASASATATAGAAATAMSFNYPNIPGNETQTQYLAILPNNAYPFPISAHIGATPAYRGTHAQSMPFFNGPFYSSQMLHPSQLQQQQQQQPLPTQSHQSQQGHQNASISSGSSSSQKHLQSQHAWPHNSGISGGSGTLQGFPAPKNQPLQQLQQRQQQQNQQVPHQVCQLENEMGGEESPSTAESRVSRANMNAYGHNFAMPLHSPNFTLMTTASVGGAASVIGNHGEKKPQQQLHQQGSKTGVETMTPQTFAMTFTSINGTTAPGLDLSTIAQNPAILQNLPEAMRQGCQFMAAAQAAQQKKSYRVSEEGKAGGGETSNVEEERKALAGKPQAMVGQSIAFSRPDLIDSPVSTMTGNTVIDSSNRSLNLGSAPTRTSVSVIPSSSNANASAAQQQLQRSQQQHQIIQLQKQHFAAVAATTARSKTPATSNGSVYSDHLQPSTSMAAKFPGALSVFPQNLVQSNSSAAQSPQWKISGRTSASQVSSQSIAPSTSALKNLPQQQGRTQQGHTQISFAANPKSSAATQGQPQSGNNQSASPPMMVGSPTTSSISKASAGGSPRTNPTTSTGNKSGQASSLSSQQAKHSPSMPSRKSSPGSSMLGNPNITSGTGVKGQMSQQQQQQQIPKHASLPAQLVFSNAYMPAQPQHVASTTSSASAVNGFFTARHREQQQLPGSSGTSSTGMLSLCPPVTHSNTSTSDPAKAVAAATNMKGGALASQGLIHAANFANTQASGKQHQSFPPGFPYVHAVPTVVQVKPAEQKQPAGE